MSLIELCGWIGTICIMFKGLPQAMRVFSSGSAHGMSKGFCLLWVIGSLFMFPYVLSKGYLPLIMSGVTNIVFSLIIFKYRFWPKK